MTSPDAPISRSRGTLSRAQYIDGILRGDRATLARGITLIESSRPEHVEIAQDVLEACLPYTGRSIRVGITGVPGVGKSSVIDTLGVHLTQQRGEKLAVLAIDPSSGLSGGSILGDKTRMQRLANEGRAFIRPSPSGGSLGGVARRTREAMLLCEAAGFPNILVETIGVGQSEVAVHSMVDFFLLLMLPGAGDELQGMKRGIMEMVDLLAVNKADGANRQRADLARREYANALHLFGVAAGGWTPRAVTCSAQEPETIAAIWEAVLDHNRRMHQNGWLETRRRQQQADWMRGLIEEGLREQFQRHSLVRENLAEYEAGVLEGRISPFRASQELLRIYQDGRNK